MNVIDFAASVSWVFSIGDWRLSNCSSALEAQSES